MMAFEHYAPSGNPYNYPMSLSGAPNYYSVDPMGQSQWYSTARTVDPSTLITRTIGPVDDNYASPDGSLDRRSTGSIGSPNSAGYEGPDGMRMRIERNPRPSTRNPSPSNRRDKSLRQQSSRDDELLTTAKANKFFCDQPACEENGRRSSFTRNADLKRHLESVHGRPRIDCYYPRCSRKGKNGFSRNDHYNAHLRSYHHDDIPLRNSRT